MCFSPEKHTELKTMQQTKSPVKIQNFTHSKNDENGDMMLNKYTKITPLDSTKITFPYSEDLSATGIAPISSIQNLAVEQLVSVKAQVARLSGVKVRQTQHQGTLKMQEAIVRDPTGFIKLTLWEDNVDTLELDKTYVLKNLRVKSLNKENFLNTAKGEEFVHDATDAFQQECIAIDHESDFAETTVSAKILGFNQVTRSLVCASCYKSVVPNVDDDDIGDCEGCGMGQLMEDCSVKWYLRVLVQTTSEPSRKLHLSLFNTEVAKLLTIVDPTLNSQTISQKDLEKAILRAKRNLTFTFRMDQKVTDVQ